MKDLLKIKDVSSEYKVSARALRYYEEMGLLESTRSEEYAYRMYDENMVNRLQKILILRWLNVSIKDIKRILSTPGTEVVLEVLENKANADSTDHANTHKAIHHFIKEKECFELDESRTELGNVITPPDAQKAMGYAQMDYWIPIKVK